MKTNMKYVIYVLYKFGDVNDFGESYMCKCW